MDVEVADALSVHERVAYAQQPHGTVSKHTSQEHAACSAWSGTDHAWVQVRFGSTAVQVTGYSEDSGEQLQRHGVRLGDDAAAVEAVALVKSQHCQR